MESYSTLAKFYDSTMGDRTNDVFVIKKLISKNHSSARTILEIACGTGAILKPLSKDYSVSGLDVSKNMLAIAKNKLPSIKLYQRDMTTFNIPEKFDVILCLFDSLNHLLKFTGWQKVFVQVKKHLTTNGLFIFDINTEYKLGFISEQLPRLEKIGKSYVYVNVNKEKNGIVNWNTKIFEQKGKNVYNLMEDNIKETSFPIEKISNELGKHFEKITITDLTHKRISKKSKRLYFVCK